MEERKRKADLASFEGTETALFECGLDSLLVETEIALFECGLDSLLVETEIALLECGLDSLLVESIV